MYRLVLAAVGKDEGGYGVLRHGWELSREVQDDFVVRRMIHDGKYLVSRGLQPFCFDYRELQVENDCFFHYFAAIC